MGFLDNYLTVNEKVKLAHERFPNCKIMANIIEHDLSVGYVLVQADFYRDTTDLAPAFRDFAYGNVAFYPNQMKRWFVEDTTSSAIGRVIAVALALSEKPNRETMEQVERSRTIDDQGAWGIKAAEQESMPTAATAIEQLSGVLGAEVIAESPTCKHGHMIFRTGEKNGREWGGWYCPEKGKQYQCKAPDSPIWGVKSATTGLWRIA